MLFPVMTLYTPVVVPENVTFRARTTFGSSQRGESANLSYVWTNVTDSPLSVRFSLGPGSDMGRPGPHDGFILEPAGCGSCASSSFSLDVKTPNPMGGIFLTAEINYTVWKATPAPSAGGGPFLEVVYRFTDVTLMGLLLPMSTVFVGPPTSSDLLVIGGPQNASVGSVWYNNQFRVQDLPLPVSIFHERLPPVRFDAGPLGAFSAEPVSSFEWNSGGQYTLFLESPQWSNSIFLHLQLYLDTRFGSLFPVVLP